MKVCAGGEEATMLLFLLKRMSGHCLSCPPGSAQVWEDPASFRVVSGTAVQHLPPCPQPAQASCDLSFLV